MPLDRKDINVGDWIRWPEGAGDLIAEVTAFHGGPMTGTEHPVTRYGIIPYAMIVEVRKPDPNKPPEPRGDVTPIARARRKRR